MSLAHEIGHVTARHGAQRATRQQSAGLGVLRAARDATLVLRVVPPLAGSDAASIIRNLIKPTQGRTEALALNGLNARRLAGMRQNA